MLSRYIESGGVRSVSVTVRGCRVAVLLRECRVGLWPAQHGNQFDAYVRAMMATTHALAGMALASAVSVFAPEYAPVAVVAAGAGGAFPDLDTPGRHRRTLHFPVYYTLAAVGLLVVALVVPSTVTVALAAFVGSAALHSVTDVFGGGLELRPWEGTSDRAVYDHYHGRWVRPRRWVRYDGSPGDVALATLLAILTLVFAPAGGSLAGGSVRATAFSGELVPTLVLALVGVSVVYGLVRKPLVVAGEWLVARLPRSVLDRIPLGFVEELQ